MPYQTPLRGLTAQQCYIYHRVDVPGLSESNEWHWDLRGAEAAYLGGYDFAGKRVLEFGAANGALSFWMESQGADVVSTDLSPDVEQTSWDVMQVEGRDLDETKAIMSDGIRGLTNGFWFAHEALGSKVKFVYGTAYQVPREIGRFDVVTLCAILLHLRDPLGALEHAISLTQSDLVITDLLPSEPERPIAHFVPTRKNVSAHGGASWWHVSPEVYRRYLDLRGFDLISQSEGEYRHFSGLKKLFHLIARRRGVSG